MIIHTPEKIKKYSSFLKLFQVGVTWHMIKHLLLASFWIEFENILTTFTAYLLNRITFMWTDTDF